MKGCHFWRSHFRRRGSRAKSAKSLMPKLARRHPVPGVRHPRERRVDAGFALVRLTLESVFRAGRFVPVFMPRGHGRPVFGGCSQECEAEKTREGFNRKPRETHEIGFPSLTRYGCPKPGGSLA